MMRRDEMILTAENTEINRCKPPTDRKPCITRSRFRSGRWEFSARLLRPLCDLCSMAGITSRFAAPYERSLSVTILFGASPCFLSSLTNNRLAALVSRRTCTISSRTYPSWSTARRSQCFRPPIVTTTSSDARYPFATASSCAAALRRPRQICGPSAGSFRRTRQCRAPAAVLPPDAGLTKPEIQPDRMGDDLGWEAMVLVLTVGALITSDYPSTVKLRTT